MPKNYKKAYSNILQALSKIKEFLSNTTIATVNSENSLTIEDFGQIKDKIQNIVQSINIDLEAIDLKDIDIFQNTKTIRTSLNEISGEIKGNSHLEYKTLERIVLRSEQDAHYLLNDLGFSLVIEAISAKNIEFVKDALTYNPDLIKYTNVDDWGLIHYAASYGNRTMLGMLINEFHAQIDQRTAYSYTPLLLAAKHNNLDCFMALIEANADINIKCRGREGALDFILDSHPELNFIVDRFYNEDLQLESKDGRLVITGDYVDDVKGQIEIIGDSVKFSPYVHN